MFPPMEKHGTSSPWQAMLRAQVSMSTATVMAMGTTAADAAGDFWGLEPGPKHLLWSPRAAHMAGGSWHAPPSHRT